MSLKSTKAEENLAIINLNAEVKQQALDLILEHYRDFGPTLATEKLVERHGLKISDESVRKLMIAEGLWQQRRKRKLRVFQMRERRSCFGELIQIDGLDCDWFEGRSPRCTLLVYVDDATGKLGELWFVPHESFFGYCEATRHYIERFGKPGAFYSDKHGIFHLNHPKLTPGDGLTEFARAMQELDIQIICANTPQAKGRVERANKTLQDRLTKELRLRDISTPEEANRWLPEFLEDYNHRFATPPRSQINAHRPLASSDNLDLILCRKSQHILSKNLTIQYHKTIFQIRVDRPSYAMQKVPVTVLENALGEITILYNNKPRVFEVIINKSNRLRWSPPNPLTMVCVWSQNLISLLRIIPGENPGRKRMLPKKGTFLLCQTRGHFNFGLTTPFFIFVSLFFQINYQKFSQPASYEVFLEHKSVALGA